MLFIFNCIDWNDVRSNKDEKKLWKRESENCKSYISQRALSYYFNVK